MHNCRKRNIQSFILTLLVFLGYIRIRWFFIIFTDPQYKDVDPGPTVKKCFARNPDTMYRWQKMWAQNFIFYMFKCFLVANHLFNAIFPEQSCINAEKKPKIMMIMLLFGNVGSGYYTKCIRDGWFGSVTEPKIILNKSILFCCFELELFCFKYLMIFQH